MSSKNVVFEPDDLPKVWNDSLNDFIIQKFKIESEKRFRQFSLLSTRSDWDKIRKGIREQIISAMRLKIDHKLPLEYTEYGTIKLNGYSIKKIFYKGAKDRIVTGNLYIPDGKGPFPAVINVHGHHNQGRLAVRVQARGHALALSGYVCLCVDAFGSGERSTEHGDFEYHGAMLGGSLENIGETLMGIQVADNMRGVDLLSSLKYVKKDKIGATGASGGGNQTMWLAAIDDRIKAAMPVVSVGSFAAFACNVNCICELLVDGLDICEESAVLALMAPRALKICNAIKEINPAFFVSEMYRTFDETKKVYEAYNAEDKFSFDITNTEHGYWQQTREIMLGFFDLHLKNKGSGLPRKEPGFSALAEEELMLFPKGKRPAAVTGIPEYCRGKGQELRKQILSRKTINAAEAKEDLAELLRIVPQLSIVSISCNGSEGVWNKYTLEAEDDRIIPILIRPPEKKNASYRIMTAARGKNELKGSKLLADALNSGDGIILFDQFGAGETGNNFPENLPPYHDISRGLQWLGKRMMGEWVCDYLLIEEFARDILGAKRIVFGGYSDAAAAALFASVFTKTDALELENMVPSLQLQEKLSGQKHLTMALLIPDILMWGDLTMAYALSAAKKKIIVGMKYSDGSPAERKRIQEFTDEADRIKEKLK